MKNPLKPLALVFATVVGGTTTYFVAYPVKESIVQKGIYNRGDSLALIMETKIIHQGDTVSRRIDTVFVEKTPKDIDLRRLSY
jgi:hypothetical protein